MKVYLMGSIVAFVLSFILFFIQGIIRKNRGENYTYGYVVGGALLSGIIYCVLSWLTVVILILMVLGGKAYGISDRNL